MSVSASFSIACHYNIINIKVWLSSIIIILVASPCRSVVSSLYCYCWLRCWDSIAEELTSGGRNDFWSTVIKILRTSKNISDAELLDVRTLCIFFLVHRVPVFYAWRLWTMFSEKYHEKFFFVEVKKALTIKITFILSIINMLIYSIHIWIAKNGLIILRKQVLHKNLDFAWFHDVFY